mmetsp:Transcript_102416/g.196569  ORF Transcript_102416/g.196569 Transcript_102416/m.196569 type:complete len:108 (-) Transcript_102416:365-688(-)
MRDIPLFMQPPANINSTCNAIDGRFLWTPCTGYWSDKFVNQYYVTPNQQKINYIFNLLTLGTCNNHFTNGRLHFLSESLPTCRKGQDVQKIGPWNVGYCFHRDVQFK